MLGNLKHRDRVQDQYSVFSSLVHIPCRINNIHLLLIFLFLVTISMCDPVLKNKVKLDTDHYLGPKTGKKVLSYHVRYCT